MALKEWMRPVDDGTGTKQPKLHIFSTCHKLIHDIPLLQHDDHNPNDAATEPHDITHAPDALRYMMDGRPHKTSLTPPEARDTGLEEFLSYGG